MASEKNRPHLLDIIATERRNDQTVFIGVIDAIDDKVASAEAVRDRVLEAMDILGSSCLGTTDDCGFSPFGDAEPS